MAFKVILFFFPLVVEVNIDNYAINIDNHNAKYSEFVEIAFIHGERLDNIAKLMANSNDIEVEQGVE